MHAPAPTPPVRPATWADLQALPPGVRGEVIDGVLYALPRPLDAHQRVMIALSGDLERPYRRGVGGPGGWVIRTEPGIGHPRSLEYSPDLAGWRTADLAAPLPTDSQITVTPDWVCEILSPGNARDDMLVKRTFYAQIGVKWCWFVHPGERWLWAARNDGGAWRDIGWWKDDDKAAPEPFDAAELELAWWWSDSPTSESAPPAP